MSFHFVGGNLAIDFANTIVIEDGKQIDLLTNPEALYDWFKATNMPLTEIPDDNSFARAVTLRDAIKNILVTYNSGTVNLGTVSSGTIPKPDAISRINDHISFKNPTELQMSNDGGFQFSSLPDVWELETALAEIASEVSELLVNTPKTALKVCAAHNCILHFKDVSKAKRRRWCRMETCGNRAKAAAHYQRATGS
jgi:predicted RNA-binding Zn ribbon-like protein